MKVFPGVCRSSHVLSITASLESFGGAWDSGEWDPGKHSARGKLDIRNRVGFCKWFPWKVPNYFPEGTPEEGPVVLSSFMSNACCRRRIAMYLHCCVQKNVADVLKLDSFSRPRHLVRDS